VDTGEAGCGILVARETCDEGKKTSVGCGDDFDCFRLILVVLEYAFQLILVWAMAVPTLPAPMTEILVKAGMESLAAYDGVEVGDSGGDQ